MNAEINFRYFADGAVGISLDETTTEADVDRIIEVFALPKKHYPGKITIDENKIYVEDKFARKDNYMNLELFRRYRSETELMRYIHQLGRKDFSLTHGMIPLGSCTMKLNAAIELLPLSWPEFGNIHPFVPLDQAEGYHQLFHELSVFLKAVTGLEEVSYQPNSGAAGEYAGLLVIRKYHESRNESFRDVVLIPASAHGTNPASAAMAGLKVVVVNCDDKGNIDMPDLVAKADQYSKNLAAFMVTYPEHPRRV